MAHFDPHAPLVSPLIEPSIYTLGEHQLEVTDTGGIELSNQSVNICLTQDEAYKLSLLLHLMFS